jgi:hypothetical protein
MLLDLRFRHHRRVGERDASTWEAWKAHGETAHFSGYRPTYLVIRAVRHARHDVSALGLLVGYAQALVGRRPRLEDRRARAILREDQRLRRLPARFRESRGRGTT